MTLFQQAIQWLNDPLNWTNPGGIFDRLVEHLRISAAAVLLGCLIAWPLGLWLGHRRRGGGAVITVSNVTLAVPTLSLLTLISLTALGIGCPGQSPGVPDQDRRYATGVSLLRHPRRDQRNLHDPDHRARLQRIHAVPDHAHGHGFQRAAIQPIPHHLP